MVSINDACTDETPFVFDGPKVEVRLWRECGSETPTRFDVRMLAALGCFAGTSPLGSFRRKLASVLT
jgi:hypothetical protein